MKFLIDVNAGEPAARWLEALGHETVQVAHRDHQMKDETILEWAVSEQRIILTTDQDFEEMIWREGKARW